MQWAGKTLGGILGFVAAGPLGSLLGVMLGHQFDQGLGRHSNRAGRIAFSSERIRRLFFETTFAVMGHIAKVDGRVSEEEVRVARRIMHSMQLSPEQVRVAIEHFTAGKSPGYPMLGRLAELNERIGGRRELARAFVEIQLQALVQAGAIGKAERELLWQVARGLGIGRVELAQIEALVRGRGQSSAGPPDRKASLEAAYRVLGLQPAASDKEVKTAYRRLMNQHHPDKLVARGLPQSMTGVAEQKTHEIRAAYERIKAHRAFK